MNKKRIESLIDKFSQSRIMVVGDIMLDEYVEGVVDRISPEAPIPVVKLVNNQERDVRMGGAANVFNNLVSLGGRNIFLGGIIGDDTNGTMITEKLNSQGVETAGLIVDSSRPTTLKTRIIAHNQQVIRLDREERMPVSSAGRACLVNFITQRLDELDAIIFSDYEKGVINKELLEEVLPLLEQKDIIIAVDPKFSNFRYFNNATILVPNRKEASGFVRHEIETEQDARAAARDIQENLACECVLLKLGEQGMLLIDGEGEGALIHTAAEQVYDVTGAGDTVISTLVMAKTAGASWKEAARIANVAAGIVIHYIGTSAVTLQQLKCALLDNKFPVP